MVLKLLFSKAQYGTRLSVSEESEYRGFIVQPPLPVMCHQPPQPITKRERERERERESICKDKAGKLLLEDKCY